MNASKVGLIAAASLLALTARTASAHHSFDAEYDTKKTANITGYVTKVDWVNPHAFVFIDSKDESGTVRNYRVEMGPPYALVRGGWKRDTLKVGDKVTVEGAALSKNGSDTAGSDQPTRMLLANGQKLVMR